MFFSQTKTCLFLGWLNPSRPNQPKRDMFWFGRQSILLLFIRYGSLPTYYTILKNYVFFCFYRLAYLDWLTTCREEQVFTSMTDSQSCPSRKICPKIDYNFLLSANIYWFFVNMWSWCLSIIIFEVLMAPEIKVYLSSTDK